MKKRDDCLSFFIISLIIQLKRILNSAFFFCAAFLLAVSLPICAYFLAGGGIVTVNVGIMAEEADAFTEKAINRLVSNEQINFILFGAAEESEMTEMVKSRRLECAYILKAGIMENIRQERFENTIALIISPASVASGIVSESVFAAVIDASADMLSSEITADMFGLEADALQTEFTEKIERYHADGIFLRPVFLRENTFNADVSDIFAFRVLRGVWIILIFVFSYFLIPSFINGKKEGLYKMLNPSQTVFYYLSQFLSVFAALSALNLFAVLILKFTAPAALLPMGKELTGIAAYTACGSAFVLFCVILFKNNELIYAGFIFVLLIQIIFGNLFLDLSEISATLGNLQLLPSAYYMKYLLNGQKLTVPLCLFFAFIILDTALAALSAFKAKTVV